MALLQPRNLYHSYGDQPLLDNTELTLNAGERVCLVGRNGCGKSTLLRMLGGGAKPDEGQQCTAEGTVVCAVRFGPGVALDRGDA